MAAKLDDFSDIARYYDRIMDHVDYDRWALTAKKLLRLCPNNARQLDAACGTGVLLKTLRRSGKNVFGVDLSSSMLHNGKKGEAQRFPCAAADLRALPFRGSFDLVTCLFDSMNFLLDMVDIRRALSSFYEALAPNGILYFDVVTERMVSENYEGQSWVEDNGRFSTSWENDYDRDTGLIVTRIRVNTASVCHLRERVYPREVIEQAIEQAGFQLLGTLDAHTWKAPGRKTIRLDFVAVKGDPKPKKSLFRRIAKEIEGCLAG